MPADYRIHITTEALADLQSIFDYIEQRSPHNAPGVIEKLLYAMDALVLLPVRHKVVGRSRRTGAPMHSMALKPYVIYYRVEERSGEIFIVTIRHGSRRQPRRFE